MQLPFVLQSAETMKAAVKFLEPHMGRVAASAKGTMVLATVKGDVHDIGKNLVDIILTNNGYRVINLGIRVPIEQMLQAAAEHQADAIGMSGLLVKSTLIMKENLEVINERNIEIPVILGGAALTRKYVEEDLRPLYGGMLAYGKDAFAGLHFMQQICERKDNFGPGMPAPSPSGSSTEAAPKQTVTSEPNKPPAGWPPVEIPQPPFFGTRVVREVPLPTVFEFINPIALFRGQWQVRRGKMKTSEYDKLIKEKFEPILSDLQHRCLEEKLLVPELIYGYFPCNSEGNDVIIFDERGENEIERITFPRQVEGNRQCIADFFAPRDSGRRDVIGMMIVTVGQRASEISAQLFQNDQYTDYLYFHGLGVESAEALAEYWHKVMRTELGFAGEDGKTINDLFRQGYRGARFSFGYPACPNLADQEKLFRLLDPGRIGVSLTEEYQLVPEQSTSAIVVHHPRAKYFNV